MKYTIKVKNQAPMKALVAAFADWYVKDILSINFSKGVIKTKSKDVLDVVTETLNKEEYSIKESK